MKAFITGATGFIGSHLADRLIADEKFTEVRCLVRSTDKWLEGKDFIRVKGDLNDFNALAKGIKGADVVFHLAAIVKASNQKEFTRANVDPTEDIIRIAQKNGVKNLVMLSSLAAAGPSQGTPVDENKILTPVSMYGRSKRDMETTIHQLAEKNDSIKIIRPPAVYGPREDQIFTYFSTFQKGLSTIVGDGNHPRLSMVYVDDLINGILQASQKMDHGVHTYFITAAETYNWNQIHSVTQTVIGKKAFKLKLKPALVKKIGSVIENLASLIGKYPVVNKEKANELVLEWTCSSKKAEKELGYNPQVSLEEGISRTIHWYKKHNWL
ncbi:MAG: NAD(P)-dependent oxidoreductase [Balneola sp.]|nr:NAD(P)-dependent oxidoreductase [Balneola sp.]MBO6649524.1 NAD(P)-dependent oxidoreductase [Balneola sp.]MBO6711340.1 NAD(P)-dependent oxidoreductase [Balneola sp.]MBO6801306.1 NAD(P)-dependent oxidoreductase [Balneola sp.]MBO6869276.1 NAD(P)-dependent oxidoreductase [Balneola sp.]